MTRIEFERSGGFMGRKVTLSLNLEDMPPDQARIISLLLEQADFFNISDYPEKPTVPDAMVYSITVITETRTHTVRTSDTTAPEQLRPLLLDLSARARAR
ncbi:MAG: protealysin inhibitor emfourin [Chloroflexota bacterium]